MKFDLDINRRSISDEMLLQDVAAVATRLETMTPTAAQYKEHGLFDATTIMRRFGGWRAALAKAGLQPAGSRDVHFDLDVDRRNLSNEALIEDVAAVSKRLQTDTLTSAQYKEHGTFHPSTIVRRFGGWQRALVKARLQLGHNNAGVDGDVAIADLQAVAKKLGTPTVSNQAYCAHGRYSDGPHQSVWVLERRATGCRSEGIEAGAYFNLRAVSESRKRVAYSRPATKVRGD